MWAPLPLLSLPQFLMSSDTPKARPHPDQLSLPEAPWRPSSRVARRLAHATRAATWRVLNPSSRQAYVEQSGPPALQRIHYETRDGWTAPLFWAPSVAGGAGEPVIVAHALGLGPDAYRYGAGSTLVCRLQKAGFSVYLLAHRGDRAASGGDAARADFDGVVTVDAPAALRLVAEHSGYPCVHWVGHGLGGQLGLVVGSREPDRLATVCAIGAPVTFPRVASEWRARAMALQLIPEGWRVPLRALAEWAAPVAPTEGSGLVPPARARGLLTYGSEDLPVALLRQGLRWLREGRLVSRDGVIDWTSGLTSGVAPLRVVVGGADPLWPPAFAEAAADLWSGPSTVQRLAGWSHLDAVLGDQAGPAVHAPLVDWLCTHRRRAWGEAWAPGQNRSERIDNGETTRSFDVAV
jgi:pimeloyl-ACP methyl ester carboxylesterase